MSQDGYRSTGFPETVRSGLEREKRIYSTPQSVNSKTRQEKQFVLSLIGRQIPRNVVSLQMKRWLGPAYSFSISHTKIQTHKYFLQILLSS